MTPARPLLDLQTWACAACLVAAIAAPHRAAASLDVDGTWTSVPAPGPRSQHTAVYDPVRHRMLVFGGSATSDVWAFWLAESLWTRIPVQGSPPLPRLRHSAIYDAAHDRMIVFGGQAPQGARFQDVWALELSGAPTWAPLNPIGEPPSARIDHGAVYDPVRQRMLVFGGNDGAARNDLHALDLGGPPTWTALTPAGGPPAERQGHAAVYDAPRDRMIVFGGSGAALYNDVWELALAAGTAWSPIAAGGSVPTARHEHAVVYDASRERLVMSGGIASNGERSDVRALSLAGAPAWSVLFPGGEAFTARGGHAGIYDPATDAMLVLGGSGPGVDASQLWSLRFGVVGWNRVFGPAPTPRTAHPAVYDAARRRMVVLGGWGSMEAWALPLDGQPRWVPLFPAGTPPSTRGNYSAILDPVRDRVVIFGGSEYSVSNPNNQVWALSLDGDGAWTQLQPLGTPPTARSCHVAIYDPVGDRMIVVGGYDTSYRNDTWQLTFDPMPQWTQLLPANGIGASLERAAIYDPVRHRMITFGGGDWSFSPFNQPTNELVALPLSGPPAWQRIDPPGPRPPGRVRHVAVYEAGADRLVIYGGATPTGHGVGTALGDAWQLPFSGTYAWSQLSPEGEQPDLAWDRAAIYDPVRRALVVHGGGNGSTSVTSAWSLSWSTPLAVPMPTPTARIALAPSRPNPASTRVAIDVRLDADGPAALVVHDASGRAVRTLADRVFAPGTHRVEWDLADARGRRVPAGVYFYRLRAAGTSATRRAVVLGP